MAKATIPTLKRGAFSEVLAQGQRVQFPLLTVFWRPASRRAVGIAVSSKVRTAVQKNRARRRFREVLRQHLDQIPEEMEIVWLLQPGVVNVPFPRLVDHLRRTLVALRQRDS
ncbi:MAG: ribonuclease P protein component [Candidatus Oleimicrobiaceae bacterium]